MIQKTAHASWSTSYLMGEFEAARSSAEKGVRIYDPVQHASHKFMFGGHDPGTCGRSFLALTQFQEGHADAALATLKEGLTLAESLGHPLTIVATYTLFAHLRLMRGEPGDVHNLVERAVSLADEHGNLGIELRALQTT